MTRNLYLGADLTRIVAAAPGGLPAIVTAATTSLNIALGPNNFALTGRATALANEINAAQPDLVGLQEVSKFTSGLGVFDYRSVLLPMLPNYVVVRDDSESTFGVPGVGSLELSNLILKRTRPDLVVTNARGANYTNQATFIGQAITRNWQAVDAKVGPKDFTFLNTHLESSNDAVSTAQAKELIAGPLRSTKPVIAVGDYNSGPVSTERGAYNALTAPDDGKMRDAADAGLTCCRAELLSDATSAASSLTERIDLVLTNPASVKTLAASRTGINQVGGVFPSDHTGVVATLRVP
jgi:endonuclease/exonuclease/phosphatase family metal-dependent hydrolase